MKDKDKILKFINRLPKEEQINTLRHLHGIRNILQELEEAGVLKFLQNEIKNRINKKKENFEEL